MTDEDEFAARSQLKWTRDGGSVLKGLITERTMVIEQKGD